MSESTPEHTTSQRATTQPPRLGAECAYLLTAAISGSVAIIALVYDLPINQGILAGAAILAAVTACGYLVRAAEARLHHRLEQTVLRRIDEVALKETRDEGFAEGYLAGVEAARSGGSARLRSVP